MSIFVRWLQLVSRAVFPWQSMAEGTRFRELDTRMGTQELRLTELHESLTQTRTEVTQQFTDMNQKMDLKMDGFGARMDKMDQNFTEMMHLIREMHSTKSTATTVEGGDLSDASGLGSTAHTKVHTHLSSSPITTTPYTVVATPNTPPPFPTNGGPTAAFTYTNPFVHPFNVTNTSLGHPAMTNTTSATP